MWVQGVMMSFLFALKNEFDYFTRISLVMNKFSCKMYCIIIHFGIVGTHASNLACHIWNLSRKKISLNIQRWILNFECWMLIQWKRLNWSIYCSRKSFQWQRNFICSQLILIWSLQYPICSHTFCSLGRLTAPKITCS